jgi:uncharacterized membrane protein YfcA
MFARYAPRSRIWRREFSTPLPEADVDFLHTTSNADLGVFALGLIIAGAVSGLATGALGIGGGIVIVPVLYHVMAALGVNASVRVHVAIGTSLAAMIPAALTRAQSARKEIDWTIVPSFAMPVLAGVALGCVAAVSANGRVLAPLFALVAIPIAVHLAIGESRGGTAAPPDRKMALTLASLCAFASALTGVAADTVRQAISRLSKADAGRGPATASVLAVIVAVAGTAGLVIAGWNAPDLPPDSVGYVNLLGFALVAPVQLAAEPVGAALAHMMDLRRLRLIFAGLVVITTARMLWDAFL